MATQKPVVPFVPDPGARKDAIVHVVYEYANLMMAAHYSLHGSAPWRTSCDDAFILGCRKLDDFLVKKQRSVKDRKEQDDILAIDYLPPNYVQSWDLPIWAKEWRAVMNKQLAHIAYKRDKNWDHETEVRLLEAEFRKAWGDFLGAVIDPDYKKQFEEQLAYSRTKPGFANVAF
jgi:hypothetical protein